MRFTWAVNILVLNVLLFQALSIEPEEIKHGPPKNNQVEASKGRKQHLVVKSEDVRKSSAKNDEDATDLKKEHIKKRDKESKQLLESYISVLEQLTTKSSKYKGHIALAKSAAKGNKKAAETIASALLFGDNFPQDIKAAKILLEFLAKEGSSEALRNLGFMNAFGIGFKFNQTKAAMHYTLAALGGDLVSQLILGYRSWEGINTPKSCEPALANYRNVADKMIATFDRDNLFPVDKVRLVYYMEKYGSANVFTDRNLYQYSVFLAGRGNTDAQMILGLLHYTGRNGPALDHYKARYYFTKAARSGNTKALAFLGEMYFKGSVATPQNNITAMKYYAAAAELGDPLGLYGLGLIYLQGKGVPVNYNEAFRYLNESAARGVTNAQAQLGLMYYNGLGLTKDYETAYRYFEMASEGRAPLAIFYMAQMYSTGTGVPRSCQNAVQLYKYFCELGSWSEMFLSAYKAYERGQIESALVQYLLLAEIGYEVAQSNAAYVLESGQVNLFSKDDQFRLALFFWQQSASQGNALARVKAGDCYFYGIGTKRDYLEAAAHYSKAFEQHHNARALFNLAYMCEHGMGLTKDINLARRLYQVAAQTSHEAAIPASLAILKLDLVEFIKTSAVIKITNVWKAFHMDVILESFWDLILMLLIVPLLVVLIANRQ